ncbi:MAG: hypothetical protein AB7K71_19080 [Polyangiaceae bacterium]
MKSIPSLVGVAIVSTFIAAACSSSDGGGGGGVTSVSEEQYAELYAKGACAGFYKCDCPPSDVYEFADQAECEALVTQEMLDYQASNRSEGQVFDPECAAQRINSFQGNVCVDEVWDFTHCGSCPAYHGTVRKGEACSGGDCGRGLSCLDGVCKDSCERAALGEECVASVNKCETGMSCVGTDIGVCGEALGEGEACADGAGCGEDLRCFSGVCTRVALPGESCSARPCAYTQCVDGVCATAPSGLPNVCSLG